MGGGTGVGDLVAEGGLLVRKQQLRRRDLGHAILAACGDGQRSGRGGRVRGAFHLHCVWSVRFCTPALDA